MHRDYALVLYLYIIPVLRDRFNLYSELVKTDALWWDLHLYQEHLNRRYADMMRRWETMQAECSESTSLLVPLPFSSPEINPPKLVGCRVQLNVSRPPFALCMSLSSLVKSAFGISLSSDI